MTNKHTPAPWHVKFSDDDPYDDILIKGSGRSIAKIWLDDAPVPDYNAQQKANAQLIAAAPELLEALKEILADAEMIESFIEGGENYFTKAKNAIAKAEGN